MSDQNTLAKLSPEEQLGYLLEVLGAIDIADGHDWLWWRTDDEYAPVTFFANCNDCFYWGGSDCENITQETLPVLKQAIADCKAADPLYGTIYAAELFAARVRKMRPQGASYTDKNKFMWPLFDACGPLRKTDSGNPKPHPSEIKESP